MSAVPADVIPSPPDPVVPRPAPRGLPARLRRVHIRDVAVFGAFMAIFAMALRPVVDNDLFWHLASGRFMWATGRIPHADPFSWTAQGRAWIAHEWLTEWWLYPLYTHGGYAALMLVFAAVITTAFAFAYATARLLGASRPLGVGIIVLAAIASAHTWGVRPQMLSMLLMALTAWLLTRYARPQRTEPEGSWQRTDPEGARLAVAGATMVRPMVAETRRSVPRAVRSGRVLWVLPPLMALWANLHGGFIFGLALIGIFAAGETCEAWWSAGSGDGSYRAMAMRLWRILAVSVAACLLNPNGLKGLIYPFTYLGNNASTRYIAEWVSPNFHEVQYQYFEALLLALIVGALLSTWRVGAAASSRGVIAARRFTEAGLILAFTHLALDSVRNINLFAVIVAPLIAVYLTSAWRNVRAYRAAGAARASRHRPRRRTETRFTPTPAKAAVNIILAGVIAVAVLVVSAPSLTYAHNAAVQARRFPSGAVAYLRAHRPAGPVLNSYDWGGYLIWALYPRLRVYVDGRPDMYGDRFMDSFIRTWQAQPGWQDTLRRQGVRLVLVEPTSGLARALATTHGWRVAYHDAVAVLYERVARD